MVPCLKEFELSDLLPGKIMIYASVGDGYTTLMKDICYHIQNIHPISSVLCESFESVVGDDISQQFVERCGRFISWQCIKKRCAPRDFRDTYDLYISDCAKMKSIEAKFSVCVSKNENDFSHANYLFIFKSSCPGGVNFTGLKELWRKQLAPLISSDLKFMDMMNELEQYGCLVVDRNRGLIYRYKSKLPIPLFRIFPKVGLDLQVLQGSRFEDTNVLTQ